jgi:predicted Rossmann fold nucleotide-binding protein DprA/Smf involved in DNA uptake
LTEPPPDESKRNLDAGFEGLTAPTEPPRPDDEVIDEASLRLWRLLDERTPAHVDDLALRAQVSAQEALRKLAELELKGMCLQRPGKFFLRR